MTTDLVAFLRAQLDQDESIARGVFDKDEPQWWFDEDTLTDRDAYRLDRGCAAHMARHSPARVLLEVEAKRRMLALCMPGQPTSDEDGNFTGHTGRDCDEHRTVGGRAWCYDCTEWCYPHSPCVRCEHGGGGDMVRLLALPYSDRDGYREEWRP